MPVDRPTNPASAPAVPPMVEPAASTAATEPSPPAASALTPEEQMEKFAEELKEQDWGHQPC